MEKCCNLTLATWGVKTEDGFIRCPECKESYPPNTQGASWESQKEQVGGRIHEVLNNTLSRKLTAEEYKRVVKDIGALARTYESAEEERGRTLLSKERAEFEEREYKLLRDIERLVKERAEGERRSETYFQFIKQTGKMHEFVKWEEARTLPTDSTEEITNKD